VKIKLYIMKKALFVYLLSFAMVMGVSARPDHENKHVVKKGETLSSISREYGVKVKDIIKANPTLGTSAAIRPGQKLSIPGKLSLAAHSEIATKSSHAKPKATVAVPSTPDTPYKDEDNKARTMTPVSPDNAVATVNSDQPIINTSSSAPYSLRSSAANSADYPNVFNQYPAHGYKVNTARGAANFLEDNTSGNPYLALYNNAETGSVIKVTNMMNKKTVFVKVVGRVPASDVSKEVILKLSNTVANQLGASDNKVLVEVAGVEPN
jgi:LysM repeat protein